jgi:hypothetical protein
VTEATRAYVLRRAGYRCEYCQMRGWWLEPDHIIPRSRWAAFGGGPGLHDPPNLAASCVPCNRRKRNHVTGQDPLTGLVVPLYNPRSSDEWRAHFAFSEDGAGVLGVSPVGRATVLRLGMNRAPYLEQRRVLRLAASAGGPSWP